MIPSMCYKVVRVWEPNSLLSAWVRPFSSLCCRYEVNRRVVPKVGKLFCFLHLQDAARWGRVISQEGSFRAVLLACHGEGVRGVGADFKIPIVNNLKYEDELPVLEHFWGHLENRNPKWDPYLQGVPQGTFLADVLTPIRIMTAKEVI